jgi:hypothetical protein
MSDGTLGGEPDPNHYEEMEVSDFACIECGEEMNSDDECSNEECELFGASDGGFMSDAEERRHERKQMGITS